MAHGVANESDIEIQTLEKRLNAERSADTIYVSDMAFGIWGHKPSLDGEAMGRVESWRLAGAVSGLFNARIYHDL